MLRDLPSRVRLTLPILTVFLWVCGLILLPGCAGENPEKASEKSQTYIESARGYLQENDTSAAVLELKNALQADPDSAEARLLLGKTYLDLWTPLEAEKELSAAAALGLPRQEWILDLGKSYRMTGQARKILDEIEPLAEDPKWLASRILVLRAEAYLQLGELDNTKAALHGAQTFEAGHLSLLLANARLALTTGRFDDAVDYIVKAGDKQGEEDPEYWAISGDIFLRLGRTDEALNAFSRAVELQPTFLQPRLAKAALLVNKRDGAAATEELDALKKLAPRLGQIYYLEALVALQEKDLKKAETALLEQMKLTPAHPMGNLMLGTLYHDIKNYNLAIKHINVFYWDNSDNPQVARLLASAHQKLGDYSMAEKILQAHLPDSNGDPALLTQLGTIYLQSGNASEAERYLQEALALVPENPYVHYQLALAQLGLEKYKAATSHLEQARNLQPDLFRADLLLVLSHFRQDDPEAALQRAKQVLEQYPEDATAHGLVGVAYAMLGDNESARKYFESALDLDPESAGALLSLATIDSQSGNIAEAEQLYRKALEADPGNVQAALKLAEVLVAEGRSDDALAVVEKINAAKPAAIQPALRLTATYAAMGRPQDALEVASRLSVALPDNALATVNLADAQLAAGLTTEARANLQKVVKEYPENATFLVKLARAQFLEKEFTLARSNLEKARSLGDESPQLLMALGTLNLRESMPEEAITIARELQSKFPNSAYGYQLEGNVQSVEGNKEAALASFDKAFALTPTANLALVRASTHNALNDSQGAIRVLSEWVDTHPDDHKMKLALANEQLRQGATKEATALYEQLLGQDYRHPIVLNNLAVLYIEAEDDRGLALGEEAYKAQPENPMILDTYGWGLVTQGDEKRGLGVIRKAAKLAPEDPDIRYHLAAAYHRNGDDDAALNELEKLAQLEAKTRYATEVDALARKLASSPP